MGRALYETQPTFRRTVDDCDAMLRAELSPPLLDVWFSGGEDGLLDETSYTQPALFVLEYALAELWASWGSSPPPCWGTAWASTSPPAGPACSVWRMG